MQKVHRAFFLFLMLGFFSVGGLTSPINWSDTNARQHPLLARLERALDAAGIDTLYEFQGQQEFGDKPKPRLATMDNFPIADMTGFERVSITAGNLTEWERAFHEAEVQRIMAVPQGTPEKPGKGGEVVDLPKFRLAWENTQPEQRVFISYTSDNQAQADKIRELLVREGYLVFTYRQAEGALNTSLAEVFTFFREAGQRFVIDSPAARRSTGVRIEARFHEVLRQWEGRGTPIKDFPPNHETENWKRAKAVNEFLDPRLARLDRSASTLEEKLITETKLGEKEKTELIKLRRELRDHGSGLTDLARLVASVPRKEPPPPPLATGILPDLPPRLPLSDPFRKIPGDFGGPLPAKPSTGGYQSKFTTEQKGVRLDLKKTKIQNRLQITPFRGRGGVILGNEPLKFPEKPTNPKFLRSDDTIKIQVTLNGKQFEYADLTSTEVWCAYHFLKPTKELIDNGADPHDPGVCGITGRISGGWKFKVHPALADTLLAREAMRLDMVAASDDLRLPPVPPTFLTYRWYDSPAEITAKDGKIHVGPAREPFSTILRLQLWDELGPLPVETDRFVEAVASQLDACRRIDRLARVMAVLRWLDQAKVLPDKLPADIEPKKFNVPPEWRFEDIFSDKAAQVGEGRFKMPEKGKSQTHVALLGADLDYTLWGPSKLDLTFEIQDPKGKAVKALGGLYFRSREKGLYKITAKAADSAKIKNYSLVLEEKKEIRPVEKGRIEENGKKDEKRNLVLAPEVEVDLSAGALYQIQMTSASFQSYLRLEDKDGNTIRETSEMVRDSIFGSKVIKDLVVKKEYPGELTNKDAVVGNHYHQLFTVKFEQGEIYKIDLRSDDFDAYLFLEDPDGGLLAEDDDSGGGLNSRIIHKAAKAGVYRIIASTLPAKQTGKFKLEVTLAPKGAIVTPPIKEKVRSVDSIIVLTPDDSGKFRIICGAERWGFGAFDLIVTKHRTLYPR